MKNFKVTVLVTQQQTVKCKAATIEDAERVAIEKLEREADTIPVPTMLDMEIMDVEEEL